MSYNNGMYTPWTSPGSSAASTSAAGANDWQQPDTTPAWSPAPSSSSAAAAWTEDGDQQWQPSSSSSPSQQQWTPAASSSSSQAQWTPASSSRTPSASMSWASQAPTKSTMTMTVTTAWSSSSQLIIVRPTIASETAATHRATFKVIYLVPLFVILPLALIGLALFWLYRKRNRSSGASLFSDLSPANQFEQDGLVQVQEKRYTKDEDDYPHPYGIPGATLNWIPATFRNAFGGKRDEQHEGESEHFVPSIPYDQPFVPPSPQSQRHGNDQYEYESRRDEDAERGWTWGTAPMPKPQRQPSKSALLRVNSGLTNGFKWAQKRYRPRLDGGSLNSQRTGRSQFEQPSPSVYSPTVENTRGYAGLAGDDVTTEDLDDFLGESRVGHGDRANRWIQGRALPEDIPPVPQARPYVPLPLDMPAAPTMSHASPTKRVHDTSRGEPVLFSYGSPTKQTPSQQRVNRPALPTPPSFPSHVPPRNVGSPMPAYGQSQEPSAYDLAGVQDLVFGDSLPRHRPHQPQAEQQRIEQPVFRQLPLNKPPSKPVSTGDNGQFSDADDLAQQYRDKRRSLMRVDDRPSEPWDAFSDPKPLEPLAPSRVQSAVQKLEGASPPKRYTRPALMEAASSSASRAEVRPRSSSISSLSYTHSPAVDPSRPLSSDHRRLSAMLRRPRSSSEHFDDAANDAEDDDDEPKSAENSSAGGHFSGGLAAMLRRGTGFA